MSDGNSRTLLTIGVFFITIVVAVLLYVAAIITDWVLIIPVVILLNGIWFLALGAMRMGKPFKYERSPFSTAALGLVAIAVGGAWFLFSYNWLYSLVVILLVLAGIAIVAALRRK
jgi:hypothetical protein